MNKKRNTDRKIVGENAVERKELFLTKNRLHLNAGGPKRTQTTKQNVRPATAQ